MSPPDAPQNPAKTRSVVFAAYAIGLFALLAILGLIIALPLPKLAWRRAAVRTAARIYLKLARIKLNVLNASRLPLDPCVVVANHSSYLDGVVLFAALPPRFGFVIKREMSRVPLANLLLRRIGAHYVDRGRGQKGARDTRKLLKRAAHGGALAFFPEGTFQAQPGLMRFHSGAFLVAARAGFPVLPIAIRGTRAALPPGGFMPQPGNIEVELTELLPAPKSTADIDISMTRKAARQAILACISEVDLAPDE